MTTVLFPDARIRVDAPFAAESLHTRRSGDTTLIMPLAKKITAFAMAAAVGLALVCSGCGKKSQTPPAASASAANKKPTPTSTPVPASGAASRVASGVTTRSENMASGAGAIRPIGAPATATQTNPFFAEKYLSPEERIKRRQERILQSLQR